MQDKDFDQLLKQRLEDFEVKPSASSWNKITGELDKNKKRKILPPYWIAAASVVLLSSVVLWLYKPAELVELHGKAPDQVAVNNVKKPETNIPDLQKGTVEIGAKEINNSGPAHISGILLARNTKKEKHVHHKNAGLPENVKAEEQQVKPEMIVKIQDEVPVYNPKPVLKKDEPASFIARNDETNAESLPQAEPARAHIKSIGGLVNFVIAQVDKRENKIIEFKDGEEGSEVSGINLGLLKFKSRSK